MRIANRLNAFPEYIFSRLGKKVVEVEATTGRKALNLSIGSPDFPPSQVYVSKLQEFIADPKAHLYPGYGANQEFTDALIACYQTRFNVSLEKNELFPLLGGKDGVSHLPLALLDAGDEILIPDPGYPGFTGPALMVGAVPVYYDLTEANGFKISVDDLEKKVTEKTKAIWVNFPSNPTGIIATQQELEPLVKFAQKHNIVLIYDNAYAEITFDGFTAPSILEIPGAKEIAVEIGSFSKSHSFAGHRMGWIVGNSQVIAALAKVKSQLDSGMFTPLQRLGAYALKNPDDGWKQTMLGNYQKRRDILAEKLHALGLMYDIPKGSLYLWAKIPETAESSEAFTFGLLEEKLIVVAPGSAFGKNGERYVRICISSNIERINDYF